MFTAELSICYIAFAAAPRQLNTLPMAKQKAETKSATAEVLRKHQKALDMSDFEFSKHLGFGHTTVRNWLNGTVQMKSSAIVKVAEKLGITTDELLGG